MDNKEMLGLIQENGDEEEKVCPKCGTPMFGKDTYCLGCGVNVQPIGKTEYDRKKEIVELYGEESSGSHTFENKDRWAPGVTIREQGPNLAPIIVMAVIGVVALIMAIIFISKGIAASKEEKTVTYTRNVITRGAGISYSRDETVTLAAQGDKLLELTFSVVFDLSTFDDMDVERYKITLDQHYSEYAMPYTFIDYDSKKENGKVYFTLKYKYLNVLDNMNKLLEQDVLEFGDGKQALTNKSYVSLNQTISSLEKQQYHEVKGE